MSSLEIDSVELHYGQVEALRGATLRVDEGEIVALVGANGAGKSSLINAISGLFRPSAGSIRFGGEDLTALSPHRLPAIGVVQVPEGRRLFPRLSVEENLALGAYHRAARAKSKETAERVYDLMPMIAGRKKQAAGTLSGGEQQMVAIGRALMAQPRLLMLDEPSLGLAPIIVAEMFKTIKLIRGEGTSVLLVVQIVRQALGISDRAYALQQGRVVLEGTGQEMQDSPMLAPAMLGVA
jgi:branched-chain amino acid transport system ATP-binding protein